MILLLLVSSALIRIVPPISPNATAVAGAMPFILPPLSVSELSAMVFGLSVDANGSVEANKHWGTITMSKAITLA